MAIERIEHEACIGCGICVDSCPVDVIRLDEATGKAYGLFVKDGVNYLGRYDSSGGMVSMGQRAAKVAYPRVFKVHDGYAYSVFYESSRNQGVITRVKVE